MYWWALCWKLGSQGEQMCPPGELTVPPAEPQGGGLRHFRLYWKEEKSCLSDIQLSQSAKSEMQTCLWTVFSGVLVAVVLGLC